MLPSGLANPACNAYIAYTRNQRVRTTTPTERLSFQSNYFKRLNLVGQASYSSADLNSPYFEFFNGLVARTNERQFTFSGPASVRRFAATADLGMTWSLTDKLHLSDDFRFNNFHMPGTWNSTSTAVVGVPVGTPPAVTLLSPLGASTVTNAFIANLLGQKSFSNVIQLEYSPSKRAGVHVGFRFRHRRVFKAEPETVIDPEAGIPEFEGDTIEVNEYTPMLGIWLRPVDSLRINVEAEATAADNFITRISPRQKQNYRARVNYRPKSWATIAGSTDISESRNGESDTQFEQHYRNAGFIVSLLPKDRVGLDLAYNYTDALQDAFICYNGTFNPAGTVLKGCPTFDATNNANPNLIYSSYVNNTHYSSATVRFKPVKQLTAVVGYGLTRSDGSATLLNPLQPFGPLQFTYHQPLASLSYEIVKSWSLNAYWNYDQYNEDSFDPVPPTRVTFTTIVRRCPYGTRSDLLRIGPSPIVAFGSCFARLRLSGQR